MTWDPSGMERMPFDGRYPRLPDTKIPRRNTSRNHGPRCSGNPEVGCVCDYDPGEHEPPDDEED